MSSELFVGQQVSDYYNLVRPQVSQQVVNIVCRYLLEKVDVPVCYVDIGCGTGLSTTPFVDELRKSNPSLHSVGLDVSATQIDIAKEKNTRPSLTYIVSNIDKDRVPLHNESVSLITVVQAAHWLDLEQLFAESNRCLQKEGVLALICYSLPKVRINGADVDSINTAIIELFDFLYCHEYFDSRIKPVEDEYKSISLPFKNVQEMRGDRSLELCKSTTIAGLFEFLESWSGIRTYRSKNNGAGIVAEFQKSVITSLPADAQGEQTKIDLIFPYFVIMGRK